MRLLNGVARPDFARMSDDELLIRVAQRRADAFEELYNRYSAAIVSIARRFTADRVAADEATQAAFLALWDRAGELEPNSRLRSWLAAVARNRAIDKQRRKRFDTVPLFAHHDVVSEQHGPEEHAIMNERKRDIRKALDALPRDQRTVIELAYFGGLSQSEIAELLGEPLGTVKSRIRLAMQRLPATIASKEERYGPSLDTGT